MDTIKITLPLPPTLNHTYIPTRGKFIKNHEATAWQEEVGYKLKEKIRKEFDQTDLRGKYEIQIGLYLKYDRDIDGSLKLLLDAMQGIIYKNDSQVVKLTVEKWRSNDPRMEVTIKNSKRK